MYLHRIELHGFKSFADRTAVAFDPGLTAIVGPNGCGKSNVIDAVRWVLGEQRARLLRSDKMESVIFNGTATRRALGMAEVLLTIHNTRGVLPTEYAEVTVGRRLFRSGESEYLLNGTVCRLKDILDLFMDTGMGPGAYSVIELKMIEDILSENAQDRRRLFEEAAGITKYKIRRAQTLRRLDSTQADLDRVRDLTEELDRQVQRLARQAKKAERHRDLAARLGTLERHLAAFDHARFAGERRATSEALAELEDALTGHAAALQAAEAEAEARRTALVEREQAQAEAQRALSRHVGTIRQAEAQQALAAERIAAADQGLARLDREAADDDRRREAFTREIAAAEQRGTEAAALLSDAEAVAAERTAEREAAEARSAEARSALDAADQAVREAAGAVRAADRELENRRSRHTVLSAEADRLRAALAEGEAQQGSLGDRLDAADQARALTLEARDTAETAVAEAESARADLDARHADADAALRDAQRRLDAARAEADILGSLLDSHEDAPDAVRALLAAPDWAQAPRALIDRLDAPAEVRPALAAALGPFADALVVATEREARAGIARLRAEENGRATFLVLERVPERGPAVRSPRPPGSEPLAALVTPDDKALAPLLALLLANHFVVDALADAEPVAADFPLARFVTPDGEWTGGGLLHAGAAERAAAADRLDRRAQREAAEAAVAEATVEVERLAAEVDGLRTRRDAVALDAARRTLRDAERALADADRAATQARLAVETDERRRADQSARLAELDAQLAEAADTAALEAELAQAQQRLDAAEAARATARDAADRTAAAAKDAVARFHEARLTTAQARARRDEATREAQRATHALDDLDARATARTADRDRLARDRETAATHHAEHGARINALREQLTAFQIELQAAEQALIDTRAAVSDAEAAIRDRRRERETVRERQAALERRLTELDTRLETLADRLRDALDLDLDDLEPAPEDFDADAARAELPDLRQRLRALGAVNELALESYEEEKDRLDFLLAQQRDLEAAESSLRDTIDEINTTARARFEDTFEAVRSAFQRLFADLFGENATADLALDGDDPLEDDIAITARPKGKKPSAITQLSGGEKTLTAIALLFAIYLVKPSPFCILDEVDAPLDDANVERFMRLIRSFSDSTQFILVTHNKLTMEAADRMYGVTMQEEGVSKLVGVRFDEVLPEAA